MTLEIQTLSADDFAPLSFDEAVELTEAIRINVADLELRIVEAYYGQAWKVMDYESWDDYVAGEFKQAPLALPREERRTQVASLRQQGLSLRAIGSVTGVDPAQVHRDLVGVANATPDSVTGIDGKEYAPVRPDQVIDVTQIEAETENDTPPEVREACPTCGQTLPAELRKEG